MKIKIENSVLEGFRAVQEIEVGDRIRIVKMDDCAGRDLRVKDYNGRKGVVKHIDSMGQLHGTWGGLAIIPNIDEVEVLS